MKWTVQAAGEETSSVLTHHAALTQGGVWGGSHESALLPGKLTAVPWKSMVGRCISYWNNPFWGDMLASGGVMKGGEKDGFFQRVLQALEVPFFFLKVFPRVFGHFPFWVLYADSTEMDQVHGCFKKNISLSLEMSPCRKCSALYEVEWGLIERKRVVYKLVYSSALFLGFLRPL